MKWLGNTLMVVGLQPAVIGTSAQLDTCVQYIAININPLTEKYKVSIYQHQHGVLGGTTLPVGFSCVCYTNDDGRDYWAAGNYVS